MTTTERQRFHHFARLVEDQRTTPGATTPALLSGQVALQLTGDASAVSVQMERSTRDPAGTPNWAPVDGPVEGNTADGIPVTGFYEPAAAWWRATVKSMTGTFVLVSISGGGA